MLAQRIDLLIQLAVGIVITWLGFMRTPNPIRAAKMARICGPALIVISGLLLMFQQPRHAPVSWERAYTDDRVASAEFPGATAQQQSEDSAGGNVVTRTSQVYKVPGMDMVLLLSSSANPEVEGMTDDERIEAIVAALRSQGNIVLRQEKIPGTSPVVHHLKVRLEKQEVTTQMALAYVGQRTYRIVASWSDASADSALTDRFVRSFRIDSRAIGQAH